MPSPTWDADIRNAVAACQRQPSAAAKTNNVVIVTSLLDIQRGSLDDESNGGFGRTLDTYVTHLQKIVDLGHAMVIISRFKSGVDCVSACTVSRL